MKLSLDTGSTSQSVLIFIQDSTSGTGEGLTGLVYNSSGLTAYYTHSGSFTTGIVIPLATLALVTTAWTSGGFIEVDQTNMPGVYRLDLPNAMFASGKGKSVVAMLKGATDMAPVLIEIQLNAPVTASTSLRPTKNTGYSNFMFPMYNSATKEPETGLSVTAERAIDGNPFTACSNQAVELGSGVYRVSLSASDLNGDKVMLKFTSPGADTQLIEIFTQG